MPRTNKPFNPENFDFGPPRQLHPERRIPKDALFGYFELERSERFATEQATDLHQGFVVAWYQLLDSYYRALDVPRVHGKEEPWVTTWKILRLGLTAAKGALDATLAGYYVGAFGDIRQMAEYWFGIEYLELKPESVIGFYAAEPGETRIRLPFMGERIKQVLRASASDGVRSDTDQHRFAQMVNQTYKRMSDGHHLDGLAMVQTGDPNDPGYYLGATYHSSLATEALHHGTLMTGILATTAAAHMADLNPRWLDLQTAVESAMDAALDQLPNRNEP